MKTASSSRASIALALLAFAGVSCAEGVLRTSADDADVDRPERMAPDASVGMALAAPEPARATFTADVFDEPDPAPDIAADTTDVYDAAAPDIPDAPTLQDENEQPARPTGRIDATAADLVLPGDVPFGRFGWALSAGDLDDDGIADLGVVSLDGATGEPEIFVFYGPLADGRGPSGADLRVIGDGDRAVVPVVALGGDVDWDGLGDLGFAFAEGAGATRTAGACLLRGRAAPLRGTRTPYDCDTWVPGPVCGDDVVVALDIADVSGDRVPDLLFGTPCEDTGGEDRGGARAWFAPIHAELALDVADVSLVGEYDADGVGMSMVAADIDGGPSQDLIVGSDRRDGRAWVLAPDAEQGLEISFGDADYCAARLSAVGEVGEPGSTVIAGCTDRSDPALVALERASLVSDGLDGTPGAATSLDFDHDGRLDLVVASADADAAGIHDGGVALHYGPVEAGDSPDLRITGGAAYGRFGHALATGDFDGDGIDDLAVGAPMAGEGGRVFVFLGREGVPQN